MASNDRGMVVITAGGAGTNKKKSPTPVVSPQTNTTSRPQEEIQPIVDAENEAAQMLEFEEPSDHIEETAATMANTEMGEASSKQQAQRPYSDNTIDEILPSSSNNPLYSSPSTYTKPQSHDMIWLVVCFLGIMASFVCYGLLLEYTTSGGRQLHELSFLFVTSGLYTMTAAAGRYVRDETPTTIPPARFAILGLTSMGSTFCSVRSLRYVIYPIQVLAKSCKPVPVMLMGALMGKRYPVRKYVNVVMIVLGVALFMGGGDSSKHSKGGGDVDEEEENRLLRILAEAVTTASSPSQLIGIILLFVSLCFDGGTGAYEDKLMSVHSVQPFDLMYNIQLGKTILAGIGLLVLNQLHIFLQMVQDMGFLLVALGLSGAMGQVFIFVTIAKFGALTCSIIGLARKVTTLVASIYFYGHSLNSVQFTGLLISVSAMVMNFWGKKKGPSSSAHHVVETKTVPEEMEKMLDEGDVELAPTDSSGPKEPFYG